jgi:quercetin dioxygenase-like cupin family protein
MELQALFQQLKDAGRLGDFLELAAGATGLYNCSTQAVMAEGPKGNLYVRQMIPGRQGESVEGHQHNYDHITYLIQGKVVMGWRVRPEDAYTEEVFQAPSQILVRKGTFHRFTSLTDDVILHCVYAIRDTDGNFTPSWDGSRKPYT